MLLKKLLPISLLFLMFVTSTFATNDQPKPLKYIYSHKEKAVELMTQSGIPASIIIAQGIHESSWGNAPLAKESNNHFGIKCKKGWDGPTHYYEDDDRDKYGKLIKSCFRGYESVEASYEDHTNFLTKNQRYSSLFKLDKFDYKAWAHGLKKCGYATDPNYAQKLIRTIEQHELYKFDSEVHVEAVAEVVQPAGEILENTSFDAPPEVYKLPSNYQRGDNLHKEILAETPAIREENPPMLIEENLIPESVTTEIITAKGTKEKNTKQLTRKPRRTNKKRR